MVTRGWEVGKMGGCLLNGKNFQLYDKFGDLMDSMVIIGNNSVSYTCSVAERTS